MSYNIVEKDGQKSLFIFVNGVPETVSEKHANFNELVTYLSEFGDYADPEHIENLVNARRSVPIALKRLSERITLRNGELHFDGDKIDTALSRHIVRLAQEGDAGLTGFVRFMENLALNPSPLSRIHLFKWIDGRDFTITDDGLIVAYKSVRKNDEGNLVSITSGTNTVYVNDEAVTGCVPNPIGAVVEISRLSVDPDRERHCSYGLHVGTWDYVSGFGGYDSVKLKVLVNPRDVVAVPSDAESTKMRVCRYTIVEEVGQPIASPIVFSSNPDDLGPEAPVFEDEPEEEIFDEDYYEEWEINGFSSEEDYEDWIHKTGEYAEPEEEDDEPEEEKKEDTPLVYVPVERSSFWKRLGF